MTEENEEVTPAFPGDHKIETIKVENFKGIEFAEINPNGRHVWLVGPNASGKTSLIDAVTLNIPDNPLKRGERKGSIEIGTTLYHIERKFSAKNQKGSLHIYSKEEGGIEVKSPATKLKELFGITTFKIDEFLNKSETEQLKDIKKYAGIDFTEEDKIEEDSVAQRKYLKKELVEVEGQRKALKYNPAIGEKKDPNVLQAKIKEAIEFNSELDGIADRYNQRAANIAKNNAMVNDYKRQITALIDKVSNIEMENMEFLKIQEEASEYLKQTPKQDFESIESELKGIYEFNEQVDTNQKAQALIEKERKIASDLDKAEKKIEEVREMKREKLENCKFKVTGMTLTEEGIMLDGLPFKSNQVNTARRIIAGLELQYAMMGDIKIASFDASLLDQHSRDLVVNWADERGIELFIEEVARTGEGLEIIITE